MVFEITFFPPIEIHIESTLYYGLNCNVIYMEV